MKKEVIRLINKGIELSNWRVIDRAFTVAFENGIEVSEGEDFFSVEDDIIYIPEGTF